MTARVFLYKLRDEVKALKESLESVTKALVEVVVRQILAYMAHPLTEFNMYEALEMLETLQNTASDKYHEKSNYYRVPCTKPHIAISMFQDFSFIV